MRDTGTPLLSTIEFFLVGISWNHKFANSPFWKHKLAKSARSTGWKRGVEGICFLRILIFAAGRPLGPPVGHRCREQCSVVLLFGCRLPFASATTIAAFVYGLAMGRLWLGFERLVRFGSPICRPPLPVRLVLQQGSCQGETSCHSPCLFAVLHLATASRPPFLPFR
jgi:hypothetical protein